METKKKMDNVEFNTSKIQWAQLIKIIKTDKDVGRY